MTVHETWLKSMAQTKAQLNAVGVDIQLPPQSQLELQIEYLEVSPGKKITGKIPFQKKFTNPIKTFQGGFLTAAMDDCFGPLSYITAERPCTTLSLNTTFLKAFTEKMGHCIIEAEVLQKTKSFIFMRAVVLSPEGEILAHGESHVSILRDDQLQKVK
ncbi:MAG: PaaI family thioesterase [Bdellovibrionales bacterium]|nr:PaaI family thioesterase [Bdellovibrionales bacterium]